MSVTSVPDLIASLRRLRLLAPSQLALLNDPASAALGEPHALARDLVRRGWLTPFQVNELFRGRGEQLILGSYVLLERLGEGGMGTVYKARHRKLGRIAALKVIRKEELVSRDAVKRFHREVRAAAQLDHPNIVRAYDADQDGGTHFFAMEYVEGTDLARLVKQDGPLPVAEACDYARQAALALQHAFERGIVHRDVKPHNLLLAGRGAHPPGSPGLVKVLDMGLARPVGPAGDGSAALTQEGAVMGTPDYIAPEQARDAKNTDVRSDLYSLGCTLYHLLTGRVPFPETSFTGKLLAHQLDEPPALRQLRPEVHEAVAAVVERLMAKRPEDRYQTPAEAAAALAEAVSRLPQPPAPTAVRAAPVPLLLSATDPMGGETPSTGRGGRTARVGGTVRQPSRVGRLLARKRRLLPLLAAGVALGLVLAGALFIILRRPAPAPIAAGPAATERVTGLPRSPTQEAAAALQRWLDETAALPPEERVRAVVAELKERNKGYDGRETHRVAGGALVEFAVSTDNVTDVAPVKALSGVTALSLRGSAAGKGKLADLAPLRGMRVESFDCSCTAVNDLAPLRDAPLKKLHCTNTPVSDLSPLRRMGLVELWVNHTKVKDLAPLTGMPLEDFRCAGTPVGDLLPLQGARLTALAIQDTPVADLSPLAGLSLPALRLTGTRVTDLAPLRQMRVDHLTCNFNPWRDTKVLKSVPGLKTINDRPAAAFWREADARQAAFDAWCKKVAGQAPEEQLKSVAAELKKRNAGFDGAFKQRKIEGGAVTELALVSDALADLSPLRALPGLKKLRCVPSERGKGRLADLWPLAGMRLTTLELWNNEKITDLAALEDMSLEVLNVDGTGVSSLVPLEGMPLVRLHVASTRARDLSPLLKLPRLQVLRCDPPSARDRELLRGIKTLTTINDRPARDVLKPAGPRP
jgi:serine/threonine-protein kinase